MLRRTIVSRSPIQLNIAAWSSTLFIFVNAILIHLKGIGAFPGLEWDESVYLCICEGVRDHGEVRLLADETVDSGFYGFHPPFYFWLVGGVARILADVDLIWLARVINAGAFQIAMVCLFSAVVFWARLPLLVGVGAVALIQIDLWTFLSNRIGWFENVQFLFVIGLQAALLMVLRDNRIGMAVLAGLFGGAAIIFKHIGAWTVIEVAILFALFPMRRRALFVTGATIAGIVVAYVLWQYARGGDLFLEHTLHQLSRVTGQTRSAGVNLSLSEAVDIFLAAYGVFWPSLLVAALGLAGAGLTLLFVAREAIAGRAEEVLRRADLQLMVVLASWLAASFLGLLLIELRNPHYYFIVFVPACAFVGAALALAFRRGGRRRNAALALAALIVVGNVGGYVIRSGWDDGVLNRYRDGVGQTLAGRTVLTEEPLACLTEGIGAYRDVRLARNRDPALLGDGTVDAVVLLSSRSYQPALSDRWHAAAEEGWVLAYEDSDWKWDLQVWLPK